MGTMSLHPSCGLKGLNSDCQAYGVLFIAESSCWPLRSRNFLKCKIYELLLSVLEELAADERGPEVPLLPLPLPRSEGVLGAMEEVME